jgi:hypothetical protein
MSQRGGGQPHSVHAGLLLSATVLLACVVENAAVTQASDKAALLDFKSIVDVEGGILYSWTESTDPCDDSWLGVSCTCFPLFPELAQGNATTTTAPNLSCTPLTPGIFNESRVLQLNLGDVRIMGYNALLGNLPPSLGNLTALRVLNLRNNTLTGRIPFAWAGMKSLERIVLSNNNITGNIPVFFRDLTRLRYVYLDNNQFTGPLPSEWCDGAWWLFDVRNNPGVCDEVPECMYERVLSLDGTSLIDPDIYREEGGYCDVAPPTCRREEDACSVRVIFSSPDMPYLNETTQIPFSFPEFPSIEGGVDTTYEWSVGTSQGGSDIVGWSKVEATTMTQGAEVPIPETDASNSESGAKKLVTQTVYKASGALPWGLTLRNGATYYVSVRGKNAGGPALGVVVSSDAVTIDANPPVLPPGKAVYNTQYYDTTMFQTQTDGIGVSWDAFEDPESGVASYAYQVFKSRDSGRQGDAVTGKIPSVDLNKRDAYITKNINLTAGSTYYVRVYATNKASCETYV